MGTNMAHLQNVLTYWRKLYFCSCLFPARADLFPHFLVHFCFLVWQQQRQQHKHQATTFFKQPLWARSSKLWMRALERLFSQSRVFSRKRGKEEPRAKLKLPAHKKIWSFSSWKEKKSYPFLSKLSQRELLWEPFRAPSVTSNDSQWPAHSDEQMCNWSA